MTDCDANDSLAVRRGEKSEIPFTAEELLILGRKYVKARRIGMSWREDAAQEFAIAGLDVIGQATSSDNVRAFQITAGKWVVANLWRSIHRRRKQEKKILRDRYGTLENLAGLDPEAIIDPSVGDPVDEVIQQEEWDFLRETIHALAPQERAVVCAMIYDQKAMRGCAREFGISKSAVDRIYREACAKLKEACIGKFKP